MNLKSGNALLKKGFAAMLLAIATIFTVTAQVKVSPAATAKPAADPLTITGAEKINPTTVKIRLSNHQELLLDFYGEHIFRMFADPSGGTLRTPEATPPASILTGSPRTTVSKLNIKDDPRQIIVATNAVTITFSKATTLLKVTNNKNRQTVLQTVAPVLFDKKNTSLKLKESPAEYFYGGGVQNGRFSHKGKIIAIENQNSWTDGGVASPTPFYWSTNGYGFMWYTFKKGKYDFGAKEKDVVTLSHETNYLDVFFMIDQEPVALLGDFYQLTGNPVLLPKFGFYEGHLNAYNRDYWKADTVGILFEDGQRYKESQKDNGGIRESLNGEKSNYQFSARAVIDRYKAHDLPLGWILPNDGYGAGYGQTSTLDSNIQNLKAFGDYARKNGVQIGLWTQSDLHPRDSIPALLQRDIIKEVGVAGVRVLKTDVAWVGPGYSFGLNGVADVGHIMPQYGNNARPFIISLDGWAGTQRYAGVWSGDQTGGVWEYIRFHIPTYLGAGLSGQPNITSDMDGIFGGKNPKVNTRDFQWKTFTPMQLNMDGWGANEKYPYALGEPVTSINRTYLKLKSELLPYTYSIARQAVNGLPMIRALFLEYPSNFTYGKATQYQYLYGPWFLVAPIYQETKADEKGNDIRNNIYLPPGSWIDYFSGDLYRGNQVLNNFDAPLWKLPVFVKAGAIIPMANPNNNITQIDKTARVYELYPAGNSSFTEYDDDGFTEAYRSGAGATTLIRSTVQKNTATITIQPTRGHYDGFVKDKTTEFRINITQKPTGIAATIGKTKVPLTAALTIDDFRKQENVYYYDAAPNLNRFATTGSSFAQTAITKNPQLLVKLQATDITARPITLTVSGFVFAPREHLRRQHGRLTAPTQAQVTDSNRQAYTLTPSWKRQANADFYEILFNGQQYTTIRDTSLLFDGLIPETGYRFQLRAVNKDGQSPWTTISAKTKVNPLEFAVKDIMATASAPDQEGSGISQLVDFDEGNLWHTKWGTKAVPFDIVLDLRSVNQLDKIQYLPRTRGNGVLLKGSIAYGTSKSGWTDAGTFEWAKNGDTKEFRFNNHPTARYIKISVTEAVGDFGSGRELYVFKVPGSESYIPGDINSDHIIDNNDLTSYINYTGLRAGDGDFEGYISNGDINRNGLIDAYDISNVATRLDGGADMTTADTLQGRIEISTAKKIYSKDAMVEVVVKGINLKSVNALSFALPYNSQDYEFAGITPLHLKELENMTNDRLHSNGRKVLYPTFVNIGDQPALEGTQDLFIIKLKAKRDINFDLKPVDGLLVDKRLNTISF
ncbi:TIM-barrel domain-containing protein [Niabella drilacis]|uniref:Alpha-glucosidase, glycosyl hydrolase family GH31 n=1 Tax=Niabella drilacis (strain DSM 25811 / CCM 8410 / CCUG 62505 / LMG 26954 / E90) TaxID=1285928 RepID=A0A1G7C0N6_NIADE|nr:TIM-barrel domain-containing protein [Niabella drilacis]SDE32839.1 Alpha-glucosidase, glycosyl hydrolase family GH31 [Niabella drilacis]